MMMLFLSSLACFAIEIAIAGFVYLNNPKRKINLIFSVFSLLLALWVLGDFFQFTFLIYIFSPLFWVKLANSASTYVPALFVHFVILFSQAAIPPGFIYFLYLASSGFFISAAFTKSFIAQVGIVDGKINVESGPAYNLFLGFIFFCLIISFVILVFQYKRSGNLIKLQIKYFFLAILATLASLVIYFSAILGVEVPRIDNLFQLVFLGIVAYSIVKHRLMDIALVIKKTTAYSLVTSGITFTYVLVVIGFEFLFRHFRGYYSFWASVPAALVIAITFVPVRDQLQKITDQIFFRQTIEYQKVMREVTKLIVSVTDLHTLFRLIDRTIVRIMCIKSASILLLEEKQNQYVVEKINGLPDAIYGIKLSLDDPLVTYLAEKRDAVVLEEIKSLRQSASTLPEEQERLEKIQQEMEIFEAAVSIPSFLKDKLVGILNLGEKLSGELYTPEDLELLLTMASEAGIAIENAKLYRDITETRDYLNSLIQHSDDAILTFNLEGRVLTWNEGARKIFGCEASEVIGKLPPFFEEEEIKGFIAGVLRGEEFKAVEVSKQDKKGNPIPLLLTFSPIKDPEGKLIGISGIIKDITELKKVEQMKREFLSIVSHELRTPLTPIKGYLDLLLNSHLGEVNDKQREALKVILNQSNHLNDLIDTVIDVSRIEAGKPLALEKEPLFIDEVLKSELEAVAHGFSTKGIKLQAHYPEERYSVLADRKKLIRVISNLLGNTLKFTPSGGEVGISIEKTDNQLKITISDTGIGLAPQLLEKVFEKFYQVDSSYTRAAGGIGMGLAIAREIVEAHGGKIWAESKGLGEGSRVIFTLPLA